MTELWLALDCGGTKTRILLADPVGNVIYRELGGPSSPLYIDPKPYARALRDMLRRVRKQAEKTGGRVSTACMAGPQEPRLVRAVLKEVFGRIACTSIGEGETALAVFGLRTGVAVVAGTGSACSVMREGRLLRSCGGLGPQFGDDGSAYWIGREAMSAALRAEEKRAPRTALTKRLLAYLKIDDGRRITSLYGRNGYLFPPTVAAFAREVFEAAREGDPAAQRVCSAAGRALGRLAVETFRGSGLRTRPVPVALTGGAFHGGGLITTSLRRVLREDGAGFRVYPPEPEPIEGILNAMRMRGERGELGRTGAEEADVP